MVFSFEMSIMAPIILWLFPSELDPPLTTAPAPATVRRTIPVPLEPGVHASRVGGVFVRRLPLIHDLRGLLTVAGRSRSTLKRFFLVFGVTSRDVRGGHASNAPSIPRLRPRRMPPDRR
jgi:hypothetical protein